jgi:lipid-A-disaccharide synthase
MVVAYKISPFSYWLARLLRLVKLKHLSLPNLLAGEALVPELIQHAATPARLGPAVLAYLQSTDGNAELLARFASLQGVLRQTASQKAAEATIRLSGAGLTREG